MEGQSRTIKDVVQASGIAAVYLLAARWLAQVMMTWVIGSAEEGMASGRLTALFVGFVIIFHRFEGPAVLGIPFAILQALLFSAFYILGCIAFWGADDIYNEFDTEL
eukprot:TRINITY_DN13602_c0_g1_i1.p2 TRINITY_DN13602_c0_g1~~TRINITY_DN13602_c0_g1_i1.p2  ORF type:complete len:116 (+),score=38.55 TRINITY_DN13602_c0_g1_i1:30-350(+)